MKFLKKNNSIGPNLFLSRHEYHNFPNGDCSPEREGKHHNILVVYSPPLRVCEEGSYPQLVLKK
jgi:hypothetical protein